MNEDIKKDRSPNYPRAPLSKAIELARALYEKAGKAKIAPVTAVGALGYAGLNGASLTTLGALTAYGLVDRERGESVSISPLAIKLFHPTNSDQERVAKRESALLPKVFNDLYSEGLSGSDSELVRNHLIQKGFTPEGAGNAASVYCLNYVFANLCYESLITPVEDAKQPEDKRLPYRGPLFTAPVSKVNPPLLEALLKGLRVDESTYPSVDVTYQPKKENVLARYSVPLGANEAEIVISGQELHVGDFDALSDYVALFKKQFERKQAAAEEQQLESLAIDKPSG